MKKGLLIVVTSISSFFIYGQSWTASTRIAATNSIFEIASDIDINGNIITFGYFTETITEAGGETLTSYGGRDYFVVKYDQEGTVSWMHQIGSNQSDYFAGGVGTDEDGNIYISGSYKGYLRYSDTDSIESYGLYDAFVLKYNGSGDVLWARNCGKGVKQQFIHTLSLDTSGDILIAGLFEDSINIYDETTLYTDNLVADFFYVKLRSEDGSVSWIKQAKSLDLLTGSLRSISADNTSIYWSGFFADSIGFLNDTIVPYVNNFDVQLIKTDLNGDIAWIRLIRGNKRDYSYSVTEDDENNIYVAGYYESDTLFIDISETETDTIVQNNGSLDLFVAKYYPDGTIDWYKTMGGRGEEKVFDLEFFDNKIYLSGYFADTLSWGGINLISKGGASDRDMFTGALDKEGNFRDANSYSGRNNSTEEARGVFQNDGRLYTILRSNSDLLVLGDSIYTSDGLSYNMILGIIGCNPISIDQVITQNVQTCYGDSTGSIQVLASGGFGAPWQYSIDNGLNYQDLAYFGDLPAGDYPIVVIDAENCAQPGTTETVTQPEALSLELITEEFTGDSMVNIVVAAYGGTPPYTYTLQPNGIVQGFGDFSVKWGEPGYYIVEVNDISNCGPVATDTLTTSSGIDMFAPGVKLYPNPSSGVITLEMPFQGSACTIEVLNLTGQVMLSRQVYSNGISINETIDLSDLSKGMYMIRVDGQTLKSGVVVN